MNTEGIKDKEMKSISEIEKTTTGITAEINIPVEEVAEDLLAKEEDKYLRFLAGFEDCKKYTAKERVGLFKTAGQDILSTMLPVVDDSDRTLAELSKSSGKDTLIEIELIYNRLMTTPKQKGLEKMEVASNDMLDSEHHDIVTQIPAPTPDAKSKIINVVQTGYKLGDKIIRFPKVVVAQ